MKTYSIALILLLLSLPVLAAERQFEDAALKTKRVLLGPILIDREFISMTGPIKKKTIVFEKNLKTPIWIKSFRVDVLNEKGQKEPSEYICHSWLSANDNVMTISQGHSEMKLPSGYAIKIDPQHTDIKVLVQALNNRKTGIDKTLNYELTIQYMNDNEAKKYNLKPLRQKMLAIRSGGFSANAEGKKAICYGRDSEDELPYTDSPLHFLVLPGRHEFRTNVGQLGGTIHYIKLHLHPYGEEMQLIDKTENKILWTGRASNNPHHAALTDVDEYSSAAGIHLSLGHQYEVTSIYNNTTHRVIDGMALLRTYISYDE